ncbi:MAG TPA: hypothetical protein VFN71_08185 [Methylomirabilota bacterium]|nr:hypothetical protein [Methylomirabilota bacterium]
MLAHRPEEARGSVASRLAESGLKPEHVWRTLEDGGDTLYAAATSGEPDWANRFGGLLAAALLAAEVSALAAHLNSRASNVRALAVNALLDDFSAITVAARLGVSRQKVYEVSRGGHADKFIDHAPWRQP